MAKGSLRASRVTKQKKPESLRAFIQRTLSRELTKMQEEGTGYISHGWSGDSLASWIAPGTTRAVRSFLAKGGK